MSSVKGKSKSATNASARTGVVLRSGRTYLQRTGGYVKIERNPRSKMFPFRNVANPKETWTSQGKWYSDEMSSEYDLVALTTKKTPRSAKPKPKPKTLKKAKLQLEIGKCYRTKSGEKIQCVAEITEGFVCLYNYDKTNGKYAGVEVYSSDGFSGYLLDDVVSEWVDQPKTKKILVYPALVAASPMLAGQPRAIVTSFYYENEDNARSGEGKHFIRLLTERSIEIEVLCE